MHPNIEYFIFSMLLVETQKLKKIVTKTFYFVLKRGEIKSRIPFSTEIDHFYCLEARRLRPWASRGFQAVKVISFCTGRTSYLKKKQNARGIYQQVSGLDSSTCVTGHICHHPVC